MAAVIGLRTVDRKSGLGTHASSQCQTRSNQVTHAFHHHQQTQTMPTSPSLGQGTANRGATPTKWFSRHIQSVPPLPQMTRAYTLYPGGVEGPTCALVPSYRQWLSVGTTLTCSHGQVGSSAVELPARGPLTLMRASTGPSQAYQPLAPCFPDFNLEASGCAHQLLSFPFLLQSVHSLLPAP